MLHVSRMPAPPPPPFPVVFDQDGIGDRYGARTTTLYLIDRSGRLRFKREFWMGRREAEDWAAVLGEKIESVLAEKEDFAPSVADG